MSETNLNRCLEEDGAAPPLERTPNARTLAAINELKRGAGTRYESAEDAMQAMLKCAKAKNPRSTSKKLKF